MCACKLDTDDAGRGGGGGGGALFGSCFCLMRQAVTFDGRRGASQTYLCLLFFFCIIL